MRKIAGESYVLKNLKSKKEKGITLISLVITITVLIILASIATYSGINVIKQSKLNKFTAEMKIMQTEVNSLYDRYMSGEVSVLEIGKELDSEANNVFIGSASGITDSSGYKYYDRETIEGLGIEGVEEEFYVNVEKRSVVSRLGIEYEGKKYYTLAQLPDGLYNVEYDNKNSNGPEFNATIEQEDSGEIKIKVTDIKYDGYVNKWEVKYKLEGEDYWRTSEEFEFKVEEFGKYKIKVVNGEIESEEKEVEIKAVAQIGTKKYVTLDRAVKAVENNKETEILMIDNTEEDVTFPDGKKIILNLSDKTITGNQSNYGTLTIKGSGAIKDNKGNILYNEGNLNIESGNYIMNDGTSGDTKVLYNCGTANIIGGKLISYHNNNSGADWTIINKSTLNLSGGEIVLDYKANGSAIFNYATINMKGGNINSKGFGIVVTAGKLNATGGTITGTNANYTALLIQSTASAVCSSVTIKTVGEIAIANKGNYSNCIIRSRANNYGITGKISGKVIATTNTGAGKATENVTIYNTGKQYLLFPTWSARVVGGKDQDDIIWTRSNSANGTHTITVRKSEHKNDTGTYYVHIYAANSSYQTQEFIAGTTLTF